MEGQARGPPAAGSGEGSALFPMSGKTPRGNLIEGTMIEKILIVDDSTVNRLLLSSILRKAGYETVEARDGKEAVEQTFQCMPDLILLDVVMPEMDGYQVCSTLKGDDRTREIPIIFLSARTETEDKIRGLDLGGADYVTKPFDKGEVLARVRNQLKIRSLTQKLIQSNRELMEKQKKLDEDLRAAAGIQQSLLPQKVPSIEKVEIAWRFQPCDLIGGDIFNVCRLDEANTGIYLLDVSGHGVPSALVTVSVHQMLQPQQGSLVKKRKETPPYYEITSPAEVCSILDREYPIERFDKYFTMVYLVLDTERGRLRYTNAGHPPPILLRGNGGLEFLDKGGPFIGLGGILPYEDEEKKLDRGDKLILYTDGVVEYPNGQGDFYGEQRLVDLLGSGAGLPVGLLLDRLLESLRTFGNGTPFPDDVSLLGFEIRG